MQNDSVEQLEKQDVKTKPDCIKTNKKSSKKQPYVPIEEQVVFSLIHSLHLFTHSTQKEDDPPKDNQKLVSTQQSNKYQMLERNGIKKSDITEILLNKIKPVPFSNMNDVRMKLKSALGKVYLNRKAKLSQIQELKLNFKRTPDQLFKQSIQAYITLSSLLKQSSIPTPIQEGFYNQYSAMWKEFIQNLTKQQNVSQDLLNKQIAQYSLQMLQIWQQVPHQALSRHLETFNLQELFSRIDEEKMIMTLTSLIVDNKMQQCCTYYEQYFQSKYHGVDSPKISNFLKQFEDEVLIPKITKSDHIFSLHVLSLFKVNTQLKVRLLNSAELDPAVGVRLVDLLKEDGRNYYNIYMYCLRQHYKSVIYDHSHWFMVEDKLCFNKNFIEWYAQDLSKVLKGTQKNDKLQKVAKEIKDIENIQDLELSILERNHVIDFQHSKLKGKEFKRIQNPLYQNDRFDCAELILEEISPETKENSNTKYLRFSEFGLSENDINLIDSVGQSFDNMCQKLLNSQQNVVIGFDTEFRCVSTKYEQQGVSLIQLSTEKDHFIIDFLKLQSNPQFNKFIIELLCNEKYIKVGHTISSDIRYLRLTLRIPEDRQIKSFVDITQMFKCLHPNEKYSSLSFLCLKFLNRKLSKYEQRSNWNRRPLKKTQVHYAALDAFACVLIYNKIKPDYDMLLKDGKITKKVIDKTVISEETTEQISEDVPESEEIPKQQKIQEKPAEVVKDEQKKFIGEMYRSQELIYHRKYQELIQCKQPRFLVDNMLKKLSAVMRNCGLDAQYIAVRDYNLATALAEKQGRIILTRDTKFFQRKDNKIPIYLIKEKTDSDRMFEEIKNFFKLDLTKFQTLSRCVKCNGPELIIIEKEEAMNQVKWKYEDSTVKEFWRCTKCQQIYWEGGMFERAKQKYGNMKNI